jgi:hypothetical protein
VSTREAAERAARLVDQIEVAMLHADAAVMERLKVERLEAIALRAQAEAAAAEVRAQVRCLPPSEGQLEALWHEYSELRILGRARMSPGTKARALRKFGRKWYEAIPW